MSIHYETLTDISARIRERQVSALEVTDALLDRIARHDGKLHSTLMVLADTAREQARTADAEIAEGYWRGPLHGVPVGIKDILWTKGLPTTAGMDLLRDFLPAEDATVVERLNEAGAVLIAKLHMTEGATLNHHPSFPRPVNPWSAKHWTGASSSGSGVAVAAGFCFGAIGSDTAGSIRVPSSVNNLTGIKPTWGRVSRHGLIHLSESLDHLGPMARSAMDAAAILQAIAGHDPRDPTSLGDPVPDYLSIADSGIEGLTLGIDWDFAAEGMPAEITAALEHAVKVLEDLGARVRDVVIPWSEGDAVSTRALFDAETGLAHARYFPAQADRYGSGLRASLTRCAATTGVDVANSYVERDRIRGRLRQLFSEVDFILAPGLGQLVPEWEAIEAMGRGEIPYDMKLMRFTLPFNVTGLPTISLPGGFNREGLPIGIQLAGGWLTEAQLIRAGVAFQKVTDHHQRHPQLRHNAPVADP